MAKKWKKVVVGKIDLDTIGCAFFCEVTRNDVVEVMRSGIASDSDLADSSVLCIEIGGSGRVRENNFDHHEAGGPTSSATMQAWTVAAVSSEEFPKEWTMRFWTLNALASYINTLDTSGRFENAPRPEEFPYLSDVIGGMLISVRDSREQLYRGIEMLDEVIRSGQNPAKGPIKGFDEYAEVKAANDRSATEEIKKAGRVKTLAGREMMYLESDVIGTPGALLGYRGIKIAVVHSPSFGNFSIPKFTVRSKGVDLTELMTVLNGMEPGWAIRPPNNIVVSPRVGSRLKLAEVVEVVRKIL